MTRTKTKQIENLMQDKSMKNDTHCTQAPLGFLPLGCLKNDHGMHARYLGKTKQNKRS